MKFLCDRCKTRYSIGDDRVRGKILKIRCKSCANVITVREGMPSPDEADQAPVDDQGQRRAPRTTTAGPALSESPTPTPTPAPAPAGPAPGGALGAAFASAMAKPPPALEEEWYLSLDGEQEGPFALADAQRWIAARPFDAELHCWSEGFDDWLPVDKVSHFRGLRKKPAPAPPPPPAPPAPPRTVTGARGALPGRQPAEEPRPRFAATMAQLEQGPPPPELRGRSSATPPNGQAPRMPAHGNGAAAHPAAGGAAAHPARAGLASPLAAPRAARVTSQPGSSAKAPLPAFDASELADASSTQLDALPIDPAAAEAAATAPRLAAVDRAIAAAAAEADPFDPGASDDDLEIGEVSRVVKLADLAPPPASPASRRAGTQPVAAVRAAAAARLDGPMPGELAPGPFAHPAAAAAAPLFPGPAMSPPPPVAVSHRRAWIALIAGAIVLVGVAVAVVFFVLADQESSGSRLGTVAEVEEIDTTRPEEVRPTGSGAGATVAQPPTTPEPPASPFVPRPRRPGSTQPGTPPVAPETPGGARLEAREIEEMAGKNSSVTQRCYMRAQRGADGILIGDVKKIAVTLTINGDGQVTDAQLSDNHAQNTLGRCLIATIKSWRFRASPGGTFRFVLHFG